MFSLFLASLLAILSQRFDVSSHATVTPAAPTCGCATTEPRTAPSCSLDPDTGSDEAESASVSPTSFELANEESAAICVWECRWVWGPNGYFYSCSWVCF